MSDSKLNPRYKKFAEEYVIDFNGTRAAIAAKYSKKTAHVKASKLLKIAKVKDYIRELCEQFQKDRYDLKARIIRELELVAFARMTNVIQDKGDFISFKSIEDWGEAEKAALQSFSEVKTSFGDDDEGTRTTIKFKFHDKFKYLKDLAMHIGLEPPDNGPQATGTTVNLNFGSRKFGKRDE